MPVSLTEEIRPGVSFEAVSNSCGINLPAIAIPVSCFAEMTNEEIGQAARNLLPLVEYARALSFASLLNSNSGSSSYVPEFILEEKYAEERRRLERFSGKDNEIDSALLKIHNTEASVLAVQKIQTERALKKAVDPREELRRDIQARYSKVFLQIGRRSGFHCQSCQSTFQLEIDHVIAIANGGTNDLDNLQLLCKKCNCVKGARV